MHYLVGNMYGVDLEGVSDPKRVLIRILGGRIIFSRKSSSSSTRQSQEDGENSAEEEEEEAPDLMSIEENLQNGSM